MKLKEFIEKNEDVKYSISLYWAGGFFAEEIEIDKSQYPNERIKKYYNCPIDRFFTLENGFVIYIYALEEEE